MFTQEVLKEAQSLLDEGKSRNEIVKAIDVPYDTLRKAITSGRLTERDGFQTPDTNQFALKLPGAQSHHILTTNGNARESISQPQERSDGVENMNGSQTDFSLPDYYDFKPYEALAFDRFGRPIVPTMKMKNYKYFKNIRK